MKSQKQNEYEISPFTLAIVPDYQDNVVNGSIALEEKNEYKLRQSPRKMVDDACKYFGSSLRGRQEGTKGVCGITHKSPIAIDPHSGMFFFPTTSPNNPTCAWIAHSHIARIHPLDKGRTVIEFKTGQEIIVAVSHGSMMNQIQRTAQFRYKLTERLHYKRNSDQEQVAEPFI